jgi:hypothetical protein
MRRLWVAIAYKRALYPLGLRFSGGEVASIVVYENRRGEIISCL